MFAIKKKYFLIIENIRDIELKNIKIRNKFSIIYRYKNNREITSELLAFRKKCKIKGIKLYIANNPTLANLLKADGIYLSAFNKSLRFLSLKKPNFKIIGSAHDLREITMNKTRV